MVALGPIGIEEEEEEEGKEKEKKVEGKKTSTFKNNSPLNIV